MKRFTLLLLIIILLNIAVPMIRVLPAKFEAIGTTKDCKPAAGDYKVELIFTIKGLAIRWKRNSRFLHYSKTEGQELARKAGNTFFMRKKKHMTYSLSSFSVEADGDGSYILRITHDLELLYVFPCFFLSEKPGLQDLLGLLSLEFSRYEKYNFTKDIALKVNHAGSTISFFPDMIKFNDQEEPIPKEKVSYFKVEPPTGLMRTINKPRLRWVALNFSQDLTSNQLHKLVEAYTIKNPQIVDYNCGVELVAGGRTLGFEKPLRPGQVAYLMRWGQIWTQAVGKVGRRIKVETKEAFIDSDPDITIRSSWEAEHYSSDGRYWPTDDDEHDSRSGSLSTSSEGDGGAVGSG
jgi:hypothetical protein